MQPTENYSVSRRALDVEDYIDIVRRHKGWIFGPFLFVLVVTVVGVMMYPDSYQSHAIVRIVPQQVPENMVQSSAGSGIFDRIQAMSQSIESRSVLTSIMTNLSLYPRERGRMPTEDVVEEMKKSIHLEPMVSQAAGGRPTVVAVTLNFSYENRLLAQKVVQELTGRLIAESTSTRSNQTYMTSQFMKEEMDRAKKELDVIEKKLAEFRMQNNGRLPDQVQNNLTQMAGASASVQSLDAAISRANQDKLALQGNLQILKDRLAAQKKEPIDQVMAAAAAQSQKSEKLIEVEREIQNYERNLTQLRQLYKDSYPTVQQVIGLLDGAKKKKEQIIAEEGAAKKEENAGKKDQPAAPIRPINILAARAERDIDEAIQRTQIQIQGIENSIEEYTKQLKRANETLRAYQGRIETVPLGEKQYYELLRDRELANQKYMDLDNKLAKADLAKAMEDRKQGELLELLDSASLPRDPNEPKRPLVISIGAALGLLLGIVIAGAREMKDSSLKNLKDVRAYTQMAILGSIPLLENDFVVRRRKRLAWLGWTTACLAATVVMAGSVAYYLATKV